LRHRCGLSFFGVLVFWFEPIFLGLAGDLSGDSWVCIARAVVRHNNKSLATGKKLLIFRRCKSSQLFNKAKEIQMTHKLAALNSSIVLLILTFAFAQTEAGATTGTTTGATTGATAGATTGATAAGSAAAGTIAATVAAVAVTAAAVVAAVTEESKSTSTSTTTTN
jgi:hypothetical protein